MTTARKRIFCVASGPSFTIEQAELIGASDHDVMVVNDTWKLIPDSTYLFAADYVWWYTHYENIKSDAQWYTLDGRPEHMEKKRIPHATKLFKTVKSTKKFGLYDDMIHEGSNSGYMALQLCRMLGYNEIILVGYDCKYAPDGKRHWFGDHNKKLLHGNADNIENWAKEIDKISQYMITSGTRIINCTIDTAITVPRKDELSKYI